jgi:hypothetical protein
MESDVETLHQIKQDTLGAVSLLGFYFPADVRALIDDAEPTPLQFVQEFSKFMQYIEKRDEARAQPPTDDSALAQAFFEAAVCEQAAKLHSQASAVDENSDRLVERLRAEYEGLQVM